MNIKDATVGMPCMVTERPELRVQELGITKGSLVRLTTNNDLGTIIEHEGSEYFLRSDLEVEEVVI